MSSTGQSPGAGESIFRLREFRTIWLAQLVSVFGDFLALFGIISLITFRLHGTAVDVTTITIAYVLPLGLLGPFAGVLADRFDVKATMIASDLLRAGLALLLLWAGSVGQISLILFALSTVSTMFIPSQSIALRTLIPRERLLAANAMLSQAFYLIRILSPLVAGALVAWIGERVCFVLDTASFAFSAAAISTLLIVRPERAGGDRSVKGLARDLLEGNRFIFTHAGLSFVFIAMAVAMFVLSSFSPLISIFVRDVLKAGAFLFGLVSAMVGVGLIAGTATIARISRGKPEPGLVLWGLVGSGLATSVLALSSHAWLAAVSTFLMGLGLAFVLVPAQTMSQTETPPEMIGRVSSTFMSMISIAQILGLLLSGGLAQRFGMRTVFVGCAGIFGLVACAGWAWLRRRPATAPAPL